MYRPPSARLEQDTNHETNKSKKRNVSCAVRCMGALLQASVDGVVLLAMDSDSWIRLAAASPRPCHAPLDSLRRASLELLSRPETGNPTVPLTGSHAVHGYDDGGVQAPSESDEGGHETDGASGGARRVAGLVGEGGKDAHEGTPTSPARREGGGAGFLDGPRPSSHDYDSGIDSSAVVAG